MSVSSHKIVYGISEEPRDHTTQNANAPKSAEVACHSQRSVGSHEYLFGPPPCARFDPNNRVNLAEIRMPLDESCT